MFYIFENSKLEAWTYNKLLNFHTRSELLMAGCFLPTYSQSSLKCVTMGGNGVCRGVFLFNQHQQSVWHFSLMCKLTWPCRDYWRLITITKYKDNTHTHTHARARTHTGTFPVLLTALTGAGTAWPWTLISTNFPEQTRRHLPQARKSPSLYRHVKNSLKQPSAPPALPHPHKAILLPVLANGVWSA